MEGLVSQSWYQVGRLPFVLFELHLTPFFRVSPYFLGGMSIGEAWKDFMGSMNKEQSFKLLDAFVEAGGNAIDTANNYRKRLGWTNGITLTLCFYRKRRV